MYRGQVTRQMDDDDDDDYKSYKQNQSTGIPETSQKDLDANSVFSSFKPLFCVCFSDN